MAINLTDGCKLMQTSSTNVKDN